MSQPPVKTPNSSPRLQDLYSYHAQYSNHHQYLFKFLTHLTLLQGTQPALLEVLVQEVEELQNTTDEICGILEYQIGIGKAGRWEAEGVL